MPRAFYYLVAVGSSLIAGVARGQNTPLPMRTTVPMFDVVSIRESTSLSWNMGMSLRDWSLDVNNLFLKSLITSAYGVREGLVSGLPRWAELARFDIRAKVTGVDPKAPTSMSREQRRAIMAALLEDRFHLKVHTVTKVLPVYDLLVARDGPKFHQSILNDDGDDTRGAAPLPYVTRTEFAGTGTTIFTFCSFLEEAAGRTVIDKTGLTGMYDLHLKWAQDLTTDSNADALPPIFTALQEQLGLRLQADKGPVETLVVDHIERPSGN